MQFAKSEQTYDQLTGSKNLQTGIAAGISFGIRDAGISSGSTSHIQDELAGLCKPGCGNQQVRMMGNPLRNSKLFQDLRSRDCFNRDSESEWAAVQSSLGAPATSTRYLDQK